jgi:hypothetical protein
MNQPLHEAKRGSAFRRVAGCLLVAVRTLAAEGVSLAWDYEDDTVIERFQIHHGFASRVYVRVTDAGRLKTGVVTNLIPGEVHYFAVVAVGTNGLTSDFSNEVSHRDAGKPLPLHHVRVQTDEDQPAVLALAELLAPVSDGSVLVAAPPQSGYLQGSFPELIYAPRQDFHGSDAFTLFVLDAASAVAKIEVQVTVNPVNDAPWAFDLYYSTVSPAGVFVDLWAYDIEGDALSFTNVTQPTVGTLTGRPPRFRYQPPPGFVGEASFTYVANDGQLDSNPATIGINVLDPARLPVLENLEATTEEDMPVTFRFVLVDPLGNWDAVEVLVPPRHGEVGISAGGATYQPAPDFNGPDTATLLVRQWDWELSLVTIAVTVTPVNDPPTAQSFSTEALEDTALNLELRVNDADGDPLSYELLRGPDHGTVSGSPPNLMYTPAANYHGSDRFTFRVSDGQAVSAEATVSITVAPVNDVPLAVSETVETAEDTELALLLRGEDADGDALVYELIAGPEHGRLSGAPPQLRYLPATNYHGPDRFTFRVSDGQAVSAEATVSITVVPVNDAPLAIGQDVVTDEDTAMAILLRGEDADGDPLRFEIVTAPRHGTLSGDPPALRYLPAHNYHGSDAFEFRVADPGANSLPAAVNIMVRSVPEVPPLITARSVPSEGIILSWRGEPNQIYRVLFAPVLDDASWIVVEPAIVAGTGFVSWTIPTAKDQAGGFYKVEVLDP